MEDKTERWDEVTKWFVSSEKDAFKENQKAEKSNNGVKWTGNSSVFQLLHDDLKDVCCYH